MATLCVRSNDCYLFLQPLNMVVNSFDPVFLCHLNKGKISIRRSTRYHNIRI